jgi:hypothetical protein
MARLSYILILITLTIKTFSQTVYRDVIASGGHSNTLPGYSVSSTVGQIPFQTLCENSNAVTQGFEQPRTKIAVNPGEYIQVYPNPVSDKLNMVFSLSVRKDFTISIFNLAGIEMQTVLAPNLQSGVLYTLDFSKLPEGMYLLHIYDKSEEKKLYKVLKIEKLNKPNI